MSFTILDVKQDYVNDVSEKAQRWAPNQHSGEKDPRTNFDLEGKIQIT